MVFYSSIATPFAPQIYYCIVFIHIIIQGKNKYLNSDSFKLIVNQIISIEMNEMY